MVNINGHQHLHVANQMASYNIDLNVANQMASYNIELNVANQMASYNIELGAIEDEVLQWFILSLTDTRWTINDM